MNPLDKHLKRMILTDCNNKIQDFQDICNYITQYSQANIFIIPKKYEKTITNQLNDLINKNHLPMMYETKDGENNMIILTLYNFGVMQRENFLEGMQK